MSPFRWTSFPDLDRAELAPYVSRPHVLVRAHNKVAITALFVSVTTIIAERLGAARGALVATLPVSAGPVYVFLALDHDATSISASAVASLALNASTAVFVTVYVLMAQRRSLWISVCLAFTAWLAATLALGPVHWRAPSAFVLDLVVFALCLLIVKPFCLVPMRSTIRPWYEFVLRAGMVTLLVGAVVTLSFRIGPTGSGVLAVFPVIYTSIMVILHRRVGGAATAAVLANAVPGVAGFGAALLTLHLTAVPLGSALALIVALGVSVVWNACLYATQRYDPSPGVQAAFRARIAAKLVWLGAILDEQANAAHASRISAPESRIGVYVIPTDEELMIARHTLAALSAESVQ